MMKLCFLGALFAAIAGTVAAAAGFVAAHWPILLIMLL
jgi:hypothetical protein